MKPDFINRAKRISITQNKTNIQSFFRQRGIGPILYRIIFLILILALLIEVALLFYDKYDIEKNYIKLQNLKGNIENLNDTQIKELEKEFEDNKKIEYILSKNKHIIKGKINFYISNEKRAFYLDEFTCDTCKGDITIGLSNDENSKEFIELYKDNEVRLGYLIENNINLNEFNVIIIKDKSSKQVIGIIYLN